MKHEMGLDPEPFRMIYDGVKTIELRLFDKKRQAVNIGDTIVFRRTDNKGFWVATEVIALHRFPTFKELYAALPLTKCGYTEETAAEASPDDMLKYYPEGAQRKTGVVGIEIKVTEKPFRDIYRFEPIS